MFKAKEAILIPDRRFSSSAAGGSHGFRPMEIGDHWDAIASINLSEAVPDTVRASFDRARNLTLYAFFAYDLLVIAEGQAFATFEMGLRHRLPPMRKPTIRNLVDVARKMKILPPVETGVAFDQIDAVIELRNALAHGSDDIHTPAMALDMLDTCAFWINHIYSSTPPGEP